VRRNLNPAVGKWQLWRLLACFFAIGFSSGLLAAVRVDGLAVLIGKTPLTLQDVYFFRSVERLRSGETKNLTGIETGKPLVRSIRQLVFEEMVLREIRSQGYDEKRGAEDAAAALRDIQRRNRRELQTVLRTFERSEKQALDSIQRHLLVDNFVQRKAETLVTPVTEADIDRYLKQNASRLKGEGQKVKSNVALLLRKERMQQGLEEWIRNLRDKYQVVQLVGE
jgi:hypothetical protein